MVLLFFRLFSVINDKITLKKSFKFLVLHFFLLWKFIITFLQKQVLQKNGFTFRRLFAFSLLQCGKFFFFQIGKFCPEITSENRQNRCFPIWHLRRKNSFFLEFESDYQGFVFIFIRGFRITKKTVVVPFWIALRKKWMEWMERLDVGKTYNLNKKSECV